VTLTPEHLQRIRDAAQKKGSMLTDQEREIALYGSVEYERQQKEKRDYAIAFREALTALRIR
jgi:hypothetical protein